MKPIVLVTPDVTLKTTCGVEERVYQLKASYADAVAAAGGIPLLVPYVSTADEAADWLARADGLLLTGGDFDVDPRMFGERPHPKLGTLKPDRSQSESLLFAQAQARNLPTLGVCGGMQLMNVLCGGSLWQDLPDQRPSSVGHSQGFDRRRPAHQVHLTAQGLALFGQSQLAVNTSHHQGIKELGKGVQAVGSAEDGLVEAIQLAGMRFGVGVQWHPETLAPTEMDPNPRAVYQAFISACRLGVSA